jgi:S-adenosyl-L-methionine hydrolase (adenosine-forming)
MAPIITLTTDFGLRDTYVAEMKAVLISHCPSARIIDVTHEVPRHDILYGAFILERALTVFPAGTIHLAVVDPGVGGDRRILIVNIHQQIVICPDNGLITWAARRLQDAVPIELTWRPASASNTFHGRDIMAPVAGRLAAGLEVIDPAAPIVNPILLDVAPATRDARIGQIIYLDSFGNATSNIPSNAVHLAEAGSIFVGDRDVGPLRKTYSDVAPGQPLALIGSSDLLEISVREGSAAAQLQLKVADVVRLT